MFHSKYNIKESHPLGKRDAKKFKDDVAVLFGADFSGIYESLFTKNASILKQVWKIGDASAALYIVDQLPLFFTVQEFPVDINRAFSRLPNKNILIPTVFLLLTIRLMLYETSQNMIDFFQNIGLLVSCYSATSRYILSGAHLMMPGIVSCSKSSSLKKNEGSIALIYIVGNDIPFAVGLQTRQLVINSESGIGVYVMNCFNDSLWKYFYSCFHVKSLALSIGVSSVPEEFSERQILSAINDREDELLPNDSEKQVYKTTEKCFSETTNDSDFSSILEEHHELFQDEESILKFSFCEAVKSIKTSMLPLPLCEFTSIFVKSYPLISPDSKEIDIRKTHAKKALSYFRNFPDVIELTEVSDGNYVVVKINRNQPLLRDHNSKYSTFLKEIHEPKKEQLARKDQMDKLSDFSTVVLPKIISVSELYFIGKGLDLDFLAPFFEDSSALEVIETSEEFKITSIENVNKPLFDSSIFNDGLTLSQIRNAVKGYVKFNKLIGSSGQYSKIPLVKLNATLSWFACSDSSEILITTLIERVLKRFILKHKIVWKPFVQNDSIVIDDIHSRCTLANGSPPIVKISTKMERGNKVITIVENLDHYCLDFQTVSTFFRKKLSTSCFEYSQNGKVDILKGGAKNKLQIALKGNVKDKLTKLILNEFGIPSRYVNQCA
ncbi:unnamed protein product [Phytomonas sp. Hart1]|nr:unnamed protein product [Phytomonas sp. Hart1]|eukprot:CCW72137.1 unnamed protein product [Phytomonas sp. isolate Hart1]